MNRSRSLAWLLSAVAVVVGSACGGAARSTADFRELAARNRQPYSEADVRFMTGMIPHHAQAVLFAGWAETHGAGRAVGVFAARMVVAQRDEIATMQAWLAERGERVPPGEYTRMPMSMEGADHAMMPGMLTEAQLSELDDARGSDFDRLFLTYMIPHHEGALLMVDELFESFGGAQSDFVFKLASDIYADQTTEIEHMRELLAAHSPGRLDP
jgi:uncharacterized protein (DUF305 family)